MSSTAPVEDRASTPRLGVPQVVSQTDGVRVDRRPVRLAPAAPAPTRERIGRGAFAGLVVALVLAGMAALLLVNTTLVQGAFDLQELQAQNRALLVQEQKLSQQVDAAQTPETLRQAADRLGMVPVPVPAFLRLSDGAVLGTPTSADRPAVKKPKKTKVPAATAGAQSDGAQPTDASASPGQTGVPASGDGARRTRGRTGAAVPGGEAAEQEAPPAGEAAEQEAAPEGDGAVPAGGAGQ